MIQTEYHYAGGAVSLEPNTYDRKDFRLFFTITCFIFVFKIFTLIFIFVEIA